MLRLIVIVCCCVFSSINPCWGGVNTQFHSIQTLIGRERRAFRYSNTLKSLAGGEGRVGRSSLEVMGANKNAPVEEKNAAFWRSAAHEQLRTNIRKQTLNMNTAKNIIFFLGDGLSLSTIAAARTLKGQNQGRTGEEDSLCFEKFPYIGLSKTYCANAQVPDSACTATAYLCGVKGNIVTIGVTANVDYDNCSASMDPANQVSSIAAWAQKAGKATGFITTTTLTHASPSGTYAHVANRMYESDADVIKYGKDPNTCMDMAQQLVTQEPGRNFNIMMGGGKGKFVPKLSGTQGERLDGKNLLSTWKSMHPRGVVVTNRDQLLGVDTSNVSDIMGVFQYEAMEYHAFANKTEQPTLAEMTRVALNLLKNNDKGYFIFIEGGHIDTAHHENKAGISLDEALEFDKAIDLARKMTSTDDTLIVVTSDHGHPMTISGYPGRGNPILGLNQHDRSVDGLKYSTINYPLGLEQYMNNVTHHRENLERIHFNINSTYPSYIKSDNGHHSGDDVGIFASGPCEHLFTGVMEQSTIPHIMAYAACIGDGPKKCD